MRTTSDVPMDTLLSHASGLRALARGLLGDDDAAEDVLQETWIAALERRPSGETPPGSWLRAVARHLALKRRRGEARRSSRERLASREEALAATDETVAQRETLRRVVAAVLDLDEVYGRVVLMRYFQDLRPREIAEKLNVPVATVDSRLHRARAKLRDRLDAATGGEREQWASALAAATGWVTGELAPAGGGGTPGLLGGMAMEWKILALGATALTITFGVWRWSPAPPAQPADSTLATGRGVRVEGQLAQSPNAGRERDQDPTEARASRTPVTETMPVTAPLSRSRPGGRFAYRLEGRVVDTNDVPVSRADVYFVPPGHPLGESSATDSDGRFILTWPARTERMEGVLWVDAQFSGFHPAPARYLELAAGTTTVRTVLVPKAPAGSLAMELRLRDHQFELEFGLSHLGEAFFGTPVVEAETRVLDFRWPLLEEIEIVDVGTLEALDQLGYFEEVAFSENTAGSEDVQPAPTSFRIAGTVFAADGTPAAGAPLMLRDGNGRPRQSMRTSSEGAFALRVPAGAYELAAGGGVFGLASTSLVFAEDESATEILWSPVLDRGLEIRGRVVLESGEPADGWIVELERRAGADLTCDATVTSDGDFALPNVPGGGRLHLIAPGRELAAHVVDGVFPGREELIVIPSANLGAGTLQVSVRAADSPAENAAEVWVRQVSSARTIQLRWDGEREAHAGPLPPGSYDVIAGDAEHGYAKLGSVLLEPGAEVALEAVLPARGAVTWQPAGTAAGGLAWTLFRRGPSVSSLMASGPFGEPPDERLPSGDYELFVHGDDFSAPATRFTVSPGVETKLELDASGHRELRVSLALAGDVDASQPVWLAITDAATGAEVHAQHVTAAGLRIHLAPGRYRLAARGADGAHDRREVELPGVDRVELQLR